MHVYVIDPPTAFHMLEPTLREPGAHVLLSPITHALASVRTTRASTRSTRSGPHCA
jgi:hypothetical protein